MHNHQPESPAGAAQGDPRTADRHRLGDGSSLTEPRAYPRRELQETDVAAWPRVWPQGGDRPSPASTGPRAITDAVSPFCAGQPRREGLACEPTASAPTRIRELMACHDYELQPDLRRELNRIMARATEDLSR